MPEADSAFSKENSGEKTVITVWTKDRHDAELMQGKIDEYNSSNTDNIEIQYEIYTDNYPQVIDMALQNGEAPDMFVYQKEPFQKYMNTGKLADITPFMGDEFKEIFERVGLEVDPQTLEEMVKDAKKITEELSGERIYGFAANMKSAESALGRSLIKWGERELGLKFAYTSTFSDMSSIMVLTEGDPTNETMVMALYGYGFFFHISAGTSITPQYGYGASVK